MKTTFCTVVGVVGATVTYFIGTPDAVFVVLCALMMFDYVTGLIVALVFSKSPKTDTGGANSTVGFKGVCKKLVMVGLVGVANQLDIALGTDFVRTGIMYAFISNEVISVIENAGLMGVPIPSVLTKAIDLLQKKEGTMYE